MFQFHHMEGQQIEAKFGLKPCQRCQRRPLRLQNIKWVNISHLPRLVSYSDTKVPNVFLSNSQLYISKFINCISPDLLTDEVVYVRVSFWNGNKSTQSFMLLPLPFQQVFAPICFSIHATLTLRTDEVSSSFLLCNILFPWNTDDQHNSIGIT